MDALGKRFGVDTSPVRGTVLVPKPVERVESMLAKSMKRGRKLLSAVVFKNGHIEEIHRTSRSDPTTGKPYRDPADGGGGGKLATPDPEEKKLVKDNAIVAAAKAAVTVAQPVIGCPVPEFERAEVRATRVLREFLTPEQLADFERTQSFLVIGGDSGHRYVLTSRQAPPERLAKVGGRSVWDVTIGAAICVHDWVVPAAEELLGLKLFLELPGRETYATTLSELVPQV